MVLDGKIRSVASELGKFITDEFCDLNKAKSLIRELDDLLCEHNCVHEVAHQLMNGEKLSKQLYFDSVYGKIFGKSSRSRCEISEHLSGELDFLLGRLISLKNLFEILNGVVSESFGEALNFVVERDDNFACFKLKIEVKVETFVEKFNQLCSEHAKLVEEMKLRYPSRMGTGFDSDSEVDGDDAVEDEDDDMSTTSDYERDVWNDDEATDDESADDDEVARTISLVIRGSRAVEISICPL